MSEALQTETKYTREQLQDEVQLIDYLLVIWKWKYLILGGTVLCALVAGIISFSMLGGYRVRMVLKPEIKKIEKNATIIYMNSPVNSVGNLRSLIDKEAKYKILEGLKTSSGSKLMPTWPFEIQIRNTNLLVIFCESSDAEKGIKLLDDMRKLLVNWYDKYLIKMTHNYENTILREKNDLAGLETVEKIYIQNFEDSLLTIKRWVSDLRLAAKESKNSIKKIHDDMATVESNIKVLEPEIKLLQKWKVSENKRDDQLLFTSIFQQYLALENSYYQLGGSYRSELMNERSRLRGIEREIAIILPVLKTAEKAKRNTDDMVMLKMYLELMKEETGLPVIKGAEKASYKIDNVLTLDMSLVLIKQETGTDARLIDRNFITMIKIGQKLIEIEAPIKSSKIRIKELEKEMKIIQGIQQGIQISQPPKASFLPAAKRIVRNVAFATVVGLFSLLLLTFCLEYIQKYRDKRDGGLRPQPNQ